jgi:NAD(P)-dependent dehydrogenase (short-subunit alcohol dehydrogenase family)
LIGDIRDPEVCRRIVGESAATAGGVDILVNNVGINSSNPLVDIGFAAWSLVFVMKILSNVTYFYLDLP